MYEYNPDKLFSEFGIGEEGAVQIADKMKVLKEKLNKKEKGIQTKTVKDLFLNYIQDKKVNAVKKGDSLHSALIVELNEIKAMTEEDGYVTKMTQYDDIPVLLVFKPEAKTVQYLWYGRIMKFGNKKYQVYMVNAKTLRKYLESDNIKPITEEDV